MKEINHNKKMMKNTCHEQNKNSTIPVSRLQLGGYIIFYPREGLRQGPINNALAGHPCNQGVGKEKKAVAAF